MLIYQDDWIRNTCIDESLYELTIDRNFIIPETR
jgi:hypothetical protein